jgi:hypothetical protein
MQLLGSYAIGAGPVTAAATIPLPLRAEHRELWRRPGTYAAFPLVERLPDGRLAVAWLMNRAGYHDHYGTAEWPVLVSGDAGTNWTTVTGADPAVPFSWPGSSPRERYDRIGAALPDGTLVAAGAVGWTAWPAAREEEARRADRAVAPHPSGRRDTIMVGGHRLFVQRSHDGGQTWQREEWEIPAARGVNGFPRATVLRDGTFLGPAYEHAPDRPEQGRNLVLRSDDAGATWRLRTMGAGPALGEEAALAETAPGRVLALIRRPSPGYLVECWSDDSGCTWSAPLQTAVWGFPPHLLTLRDGRLLCSVGVRREPFGVQAVVSADGGRSWDVAHPAVLRTDGETRDLGYPVSVQLDDASIFTVYYLTAGGVTHVAATRWELPW